MDIKSKVYQRQVYDVAPASVSYNYLNTRADIEGTKLLTKTFAEGTKIAGEIVEEQNQIKMLEQQRQLSTFELQARDQYLYGNGKYNGVRGKEAYKKSMSDLQNSLGSYWTATKNQKENKNLMHRFTMQVDNNISAFTHQEMDNKSLLNYTRNQQEYSQLILSRARNQIIGNIEGAQLDNQRLEEIEKSMLAYVNGNNSYGQMRFADDNVRKAMIKQTKMTAWNQYLDSYSNEMWNSSQEGNNLTAVSPSPVLSMSEKEIADIVGVTNMNGEPDLNFAKQLKAQYSNNLREITQGTFDPVLNSQMSQLQQVSDNTIDTDRVTFNDVKDFTTDRNIALGTIANYRDKWSNLYKQELLLAGDNPTRIKMVKDRWRNKIKEILPSNFTNDNIINDVKDALIIDSTAKQGQAIYKSILRDYEVSKPKPRMTKEQLALDTTLRNMGGAGYLLAEILPQNTRYVKEKEKYDIERNEYLKNETIDFILGGK